MAGLGIKKPGQPGYSGYQDDVGSVAADYMGKDSLLMQRANATGLQFANRRGLGNSSLAAQASQTAVLDQIVPMASQTASQNYGKNLSGIQFGERRAENNQTAFLERRAAKLTSRLRMGENKQLASLQKGQTRLEGKVARRNAAQANRFERGQTVLGAKLQKSQTRLEAQQTRRLSRIEAGQQRRAAIQAAALQRKENVQNANLQQDQSKLESDLRAGENQQLANLQRKQTKLESGLKGKELQQAAKLDRQSTRLEGKLQAERDKANAIAQKQLKKMDLDRDARQGAETMVNNIFNDYEQSLSTILSNPDLPAEERAALIQNAKARVEQRMKMVEDIHGKTFTWPKGIFKMPTDSGGPSETVTGILGDASYNPAGTWKDPKTGETATGLYTIDNRQLYDLAQEMGVSISTDKGPANSVKVLKEVTDKLRKQGLIGENERLFRQAPEGGDIQGQWLKDLESFGSTKKPTKPTEPWIPGS